MDALERAVLDPATGGFGGLFRRREETPGEEDGDEGDDGDPNPN